MLPRCPILFVFLATALALGAPRLVRGQKLGSDLAGLNLCLYGDCEARGSYTADPFGWANPAAMPILVLRYVPRGAFVSGSYFKLNAGGIGTDISSPSLSLSATPVVLQLTGVYAEGKGFARSLPGVEITMRTRILRLAAAVDLDGLLPVRGWAVGLMGSLPVGTSDIRATSGGFTVLESKEKRTLDLTAGVHWRGGEREWLMAGAFANGIRDDLTTAGLDPITLSPYHDEGTTDAWFMREGVSVLPFVPLGLAAGKEPLAEWLGEIRLGADLAQTNIAVPGEGGRHKDVAYFGVDARLVPDAWNPLAQWLRLVLIGGTDTDNGWGIGAGLYGNGPLEFLSCNPAYSSRPMAKSLGDRVEVWSATCAAALPF
ncbi:MAG: hypothetical protein HY699_03080 [Deltaproteobacteria bacterium]|nr:hypothetical protein [Deltaproteobacteria bacterium]